MSENPTARGRLLFALLAASATVGALALGWAAGRSRVSSPAPRAGAVRGELAFLVSCASCHGPEGRGDGAAALDLRPPPRDFAARPWRTEVRRESIRKVILEGIPGTAMPGSQTALAPEDVDSLVEYVYDLATSRPPVHPESSPEQRLLWDAGFVDLRGTSTPPLTVTDAAGRVVTLSDLKGRFVLINFWGTTCVHCLKEMPHLRKLEADLADRPFSVLHVCADAEDIKSAQEVADRAAPGVRAVMDDTGLGLARFEVGALPVVWLIGPNGKAIGRTQGARDWTKPACRRLIEHWLPAPTTVNRTKAD